MNPTPTELAERIERRLRPHIAHAIEHQPEEIRELIKQRPDQTERTSSTEPAGPGQPGKWVHWITHHVVDDDGIPKPVATIAGTLVGITVAGPFDALEYWYLPDPELDPDLPEVAYPLTGCWRREL